MRKILFAVAMLAGLAACGPTEEHCIDQCLRSQLFQDCLSRIPKGPEKITAAGNDWDEVVSECRSAAYYQSMRSQCEVVKPECRLSYTQF